jgi:hypothetical protein
VKPGKDGQPQDKSSHRLQADQEAPPDDGNVDGSQVVVKAVEDADVAEGRHDDQAE